MDYDATAMPATYRQARAHPDAVLRMWLDAVETAAPGSGRGWIVDAGCGTGRFSAGLAEAYGRPVFAVDRSARMLAEADAGSGARAVSWCRGDACSLPLAAGAADLVFSSNAIHHMPLREAAAEFARVLRPDGFVVLRNCLRDILDGYPYLEFFPEALAASRRMIPSRSEIVAAFGAAELACVRSDVVEQPVADSPEAYLDKIRGRAYSDLSVISDGAFQAGVERMAVAVAGGWGERSLREPVALLAFRRRAAPR